MIKNNPLIFKIISNVSVTGSVVAIIKVYPEIVERNTNNNNLNSNNIDSVKQDTLFFRIPSFISNQLNKKKYPLLIYQNMVLILCMLFSFHSPYIRTMKLCFGLVKAI